jgi:hypothetical protein
LADSSAISEIVKYLVSDPIVSGTVGWVGLFLTLGGFVVAIDQIRRTKRAAEAAMAATKALTRSVFSRERLIELGSAIAHIDNARERITQARYEGALVFIDFSLTECVQIHELLVDTSEQKKFYKCIVRLRKLGEELSMAGEGSESDASLALALEARAIVGVLNEMAAKLRYSYNDEGSGR